ncbi:hypothetical protein KKB83_04095 [Patescibacteria group bacterium]|nr:hypothetical protein [Patescibacteria group bacterium]
MINYNQNDPIYSKIFLGESKKYTLKSDGCYVFSVAYCLGIDPIECNRRLFVAGAFYADSTGDECLLNHSKIKFAFPGRIEDVVKYNSYNNDVCLGAIEKYGKCIVKVDYDGSNSTAFDTHFVTFIGDGKLFDSLGGKIKPVSTYPILSGLRIILLKPVQEEEDMSNITEEETKILGFIREGITINGAKRDMTEGDVRQGIGYITDNIEGKLEKLEKKVETLTEKVKTLTESQLYDGKSASDWHSSYDSASAEVQTWKKKSLQASTFSDIVSEIINRLFKK